MKFFVLVSAFLVVARAGVVVPTVGVHQATVVAAVPGVHHARQYHSQDTLGQYTYGYSNELSAKNEVRSADGETVGSYSYVDAEGKIQNVQYRSDPVHGFRVFATNLPVGPSPIPAPFHHLPEPVKDTPEVAEARAKHMEALRHAEQQAKVSGDSVEVKSAVHTHPSVVISAATPAAVVRTAAPSAAIELVRTAPLIGDQSFGYSFDVNYGDIYSVSSFGLHHQPIFYTAPGHLYAAVPFVGGTAPTAVIGGQVHASAPEAPKDMPEVVEARAKHMETVENIRKDLEKEQQQQQQHDMA